MRNMGRYRASQSVITPQVGRVGQDALMPAVGVGGGTLAFQESSAQSDLPDLDGPKRQEDRRV